VSLNPTVRALTVRLNSHSSHNWVNHSIKYECTSLQSQQSGHHLLISHTWTDWSSHSMMTIVCARENLMHDTVQIHVGHSAWLSVYRHSKLICFLNPRASEAANGIPSVWQVLTHDSAYTNTERRAKRSLSKWCNPTLCFRHCKVQPHQTQSLWVHCLSPDLCASIDHRPQIVKPTFIDNCQHRANIIIASSLLTYKP
jgi:hypothetical protein